MSYIKITLLFAFSVICINGFSQEFDASKMVLQLSSARSMAFADFDKDGNMDVVSIGDLSAKIGYNKGESGFDVIDLDTENGGVTVITLDFENDGDIDIVTGDFNQMVYYKNEGTDGFSSKVIESVYNVDVFENIERLDVLDYNNDGLVDIVGVNFTSSGLFVIKNLGGGNFDSGTTVYNPGEQFSHVKSVDFNGDGYQDIVSSTYTNIILSLNQKDGTFESDVIISDSGINPEAFDVGDIDSDGDFDIILANTGKDISVFFNNGGSFNNSEIVSETNDQFMYVTTADIDGDDDLDIASASWDGKVTYYLNSKGAFGEQVVLTDQFQNAFEVDFSDINKDGKPDLVALAVGSGEIDWFENISKPVVLGTYLQKISVYPTLFDNKITLTSANRDLSNYKIYDLNGVLHLNGDLSSNQAIIDTQNLLQQVYIIEVSSFQHAERYVVVKRGN